MIPDAQQPQRCDHECVCKKYGEWYEFATEIDAVCKYSIYCDHFKAPAPSPHPPAPEPVCLGELDCHEITRTACSHLDKCFQQHEHDTAIARTATLAENKRVLDHLDNQMNEILSGIQSSSMGGPLSERGRAQATIISDFFRLSKALRQSTTVGDEQRLKSVN